MPLSPNRNTIAKDLLSKSGAIKMASLVELWTNWSTYVGHENNKPSFTRLCETDTKTIDEEIKERQKFCKILRQWWSFGFKPTGMQDTDILDQKLNELRSKQQKAVWARIRYGIIYLVGLWILIEVNKVIYGGLLLDPSVADLLGMSQSALKASGLPLGRTLIGWTVIIWIIFYLRKRWRFRGLPRKAAPVLEPLKKRLLNNLTRWSKQDLQNLAGLVAALPAWQPNSPSNENASAAGTRPELSTTHNVSAISESNPIPAGDVKKPTRIKINAKAVVQDIRAEMADVGLMQKYGLSAKQLTALYKKLEEAGLLKKAKHE